MNRVGWRSVRGVAGLLIGAGLLAAAVAFAGQGIDWHVLRGANPATLAAMAALVAVNLGLTGLLFWAVTRIFDADPPVGPGRMTALICVSALLNYLPMLRAGLLGRAAYLRLHHGLAVRQSVVILGVVLGLAAIVLPTMAAAVWLWRGWGGWIACAAAVAGLAMLAGPVARRVLRRPLPEAGAVPGAVPGAGWWVVLRAADVLAASARLWLAFGIVGQPIGYREALVAGAAALAVKLVGLTPNGLGLSEWAVAALTSAMGPVTTAEAAAAALVDRAVEVVVVAAAGVIGAWGLRGNGRGREREVSGC